jgi:hypothetical protein
MIYLWLKKYFYNCTLPRFGPQCQYELYYHYHFVFIKLFNKNYYLTIVQKTYNQSAKIVRMINHQIVVRT